MNKTTLLISFSLALSGCIGSPGDGGCDGHKCLELKRLSSMKAADQPFDESSPKFDVVPNRGDEDEILNDESPNVLLSITPIESEDENISFDDQETKPVELERSTLSRSLTSNYSPGCSTFGINLYSEISAKPGVTHCIYYEIKQKSRVQFFQVDQESKFVDKFDILVNQDINGDYNLSYLTKSSGSPIMHLDAGHYYVFYSTPKEATTTSTVRVGAAVNAKNVDSYEPNDSLLTAFVNSDEVDISTYTGNLDYSGDIDYFRFNAANGQIVRSEFSSSDNSHQLQMLNGSDWIDIGKDTTITPHRPTIINFRVRPKVNGTVNPPSLYKWKIGSHVKRVTDVKVWSDEKLVIPQGMFRKFHNELKWKAKALDSTGNIIRGARIEFEWGTSSINFTYDFENTGSDGYAQGFISTPDCEGDFEIDRRDMVTRDMWHIEYDPGVVRWRSTDNKGVAVGHRDTIINVFHVCDEDLMFTARHMENGGSCSESTIYCPKDYINAPYPNPARIFTDRDLMWKHRGMTQTIPTFKP